VSSPHSSLVWFRRDLRLSDNLALNAALRRGGAIVPVFIHDDAGEGTWKLRGPGRRWLESSLAALDASLREHGSRLVVLEGDSAEMLRRVAVAVGADAVFWNKRYEPHATARDAVVQARLEAAGIAARSFEGSLHFNPDAVQNRQEKPFQVFTPFWRHCSSLSIAAPERLSSQEFPAPSVWPVSAPLAEVAAGPTSAGGRFALGEPGELGATKRLRAFLKSGVDAYAEARDVPSLDGTSRLSAHLCFGEITPRQIWAAVAARSRSTGVFPPSRGAAVFLKELGWREFA
jgi:deoxyribodipyrimidine photo-lyase